MKFLETSSIKNNRLLLRKTFKEQGYLYFQSFFTPKTIQELQNRVLMILEDQRWGKVEEKYLTPNSPVHRIKSDAFFCCLQAIMKEELLHQFANQTKITKLIRELIKQEVFLHPRKMVRITYPYKSNPEDHIPAHQDLIYVKGELDTIIAWIPLGNYPPYFGGLQVAHGSHKLGLVAVKQDPSVKFSGCDAANIENLGLDWREGNYRLGDLLLMHTLTIHSSGKNKSRHFRLSIDCRYSSIHGNINQHQLVPPYYPKIPSWEELTKNWQQKNLVVPPKSLTIETKYIEPEKIMRRPSLFL